MQIFFGNISATKKIRILSPKPACSSLVTGLSYRGNSFDNFVNDN